MEGFYANKCIYTKDARENMEAITDDVLDYNETVIITRSKKRNVVMISQSAYNSWQETLYLLGSVANREAIANSLKQLENQAGGADETNCATTLCKS